MVQSALAANRIEVQGHRGARGMFPENTLPAFEYAISVGVDTLELDVSATSDDQLVVNHDLYLNPVICLAPGGKKIESPIAIRSLTLKEIQKYDCGTLKNPKFPMQKSVPGTSIPSLRDVLKLAKNKSIRFNIEAKSLPALPDLTPEAKKYAQMLLSVIDEFALLDRANIQSFDHRILKEAKKQNPKVKIAALIEGTLPDLSAVAKNLGAEIISPNLGWIIKPDVETLHKMGVKVIPWTANEEREWVYLTAIGVDGIITDYPEQLIEFLKKNRLR